MKNFLLCLAAMLLVAAPSTLAILTEEQIAAIKDIIETKFMGEQGVPGMSISVVQGDTFEQIYATGYGFSNIAENIPSTNETLFGIGSLSKMISSLFVVKLLNDKFPDKGEGVLDMPIRTLAPAYNLTFIDRFRSEYMTFRDLLTHKVCIAGSTEILGAAGGFTDKYDVVYRQRFCPQTCHFRSVNWAYNHAMVHVAAEVAAHIHGGEEEFEDMLIKFLRDSVGMKDTRTIRIDEDFDAIPNMSQPYYRRGGEFYPYNKTLFVRAGYIPAAGGIFTTATDMAHFMALLGNYGVNMAGERVVQEHVIKWMTRNSNPFQNAPFKGNEGDRPQGDIGYGVGLILGSHDGWERLRHTGYVAPYGSTMNVFPKLKLGIFTVTNGPGGGPNHDMIHTLVYDLVQGFVKANEVKAKRYEEVPSSELSLNPDPFKDFRDLYAKPATGIVENEDNLHLRLNHSILVGTYGLGVAGQFNILNLNETTLYLQFGQFGTAYLHVRPETPAIYDGQIDSDLVHQWYADGDGAEFPAVSVDFSVPLVAGVKVGNDVYPFVKGFTLDMLPSQPYKDDSC